MDELRIDCDDCVAQGTPACTDCVVTYLCRDPGDAVIIDVEEARALRMLARGGLVPELRHEAASGVARPVADVVRIPGAAG
jgi:hypothetical protein